MLGLSYFEISNPIWTDVIQPDADKFISYYIAWRLPENSTLLSLPKTVRKQIGETHERFPAS
jgi:hypothetical protein